MTAPEIIAITSVAGTLIGIVGFVIGNARVESRKRGRVYERLDEEIAKVDGTYVRKDICAVTHKAVNESLTEIKTDLKKLLFKNGVK